MEELFSCPQLSEHYVMLKVSGDILKQKKMKETDCVIHHVAGYLLLMRVKKKLVSHIYIKMEANFLLLLCFVKFPES